MTGKHTKHQGLLQMHNIKKLKNEQTIVDIQLQKHMNKMYLKECNTPIHRDQETQMKTSKSSHKMLFPMIKVKPIFDEKHEFKDHSINNKEN